MKSRILYHILNILSVICGLGSFLAFFGMVGLIHDRGFSGGVLEAALLSFGLFAGAVILYALWDSGTRLIRIEEGQRRLMRDLPKGNEDKPDA